MAHVLIVYYQVWCNTADLLEMNEANLTQVTINSPCPYNALRSIAAHLRMSTSSCTLTNDSFIGCRHKCVNNMR